MSSPKRAINSVRFSNLDLLEFEILTNPLTRGSRSRQGGALNAMRLAPIEEAVPVGLATAGGGLTGKTSERFPITGVGIESLAKSARV
ncbi:hypothetical protein NPIL_533031 [Nephila pilipes]|uniref:Uncharacterized protein n=1 Tax=Nephila pilipes TaxID=299642 RepID=A0A8X6TRZ9_NEPPI|nr:hypothetical protein NPIL_533031 [Nephila pilipes]